MLKLLVDENFDNTIVRGLFRRNPTLDMVRVQKEQIRKTGWTN
jgi:hypothetical protein